MVRAVTRQNREVAAGGGVRVKSPVFLHNAALTEVQKSAETAETPDRELDVLKK